MNMEMIMTMIQNFGFPVVCVMALAWFASNTVKENRDEAKTREDRLNKQIDGFQDTMESFNQTLIRIDTRLEVLEKKDN